MPDRDLVLSDRLDLAAAVDHLLSKGVVLTGDATLSLAGVDLVYVGLNVLVASVETLRGSHPPPRPAPAATGPDPSPRIERREPAPEVRAGALSPSSTRRYAGFEVPTPGVASAGDVDERPERGLARLVLTLIELLRQVLERQALRRVEGDGLTEEQVERMGIALMELEAKMAELRSAFGLTEEDLTLDLGPLGRLQ
jgi:hypothetical protein